MKVKDYIWLGSKSIRNSRSAKMTIVGITVSMLLLITVIWIGFAFYFDVQHKLNEHSYNNVVTIDYSGNGLTAPKIDSSGNLSNKVYYYDNDTAHELINKNSSNITEKNDSFMITLQPGINQLHINETTHFSNTLNTLKFIDITTNRIFLSNIDNAVKTINGTGILCAGNGFTNSNAKNEIIVSERWLAEFGLDKTIINEQISLSIDVPVTKFAKNNFSFFSAALDDDNNPNNLHRNSNPKNYTAQEFAGGIIDIFNSFTVVGIISNEYYTDDLNTEFDADLWLPTAALYTNNNTTYMPTITEQTLYQDTTQYAAHVLTYADNDIIALSNRATLEDGVLFPFFIEGGYDSLWIRKAQQNRWTTSRNSYSLTPIVSTRMELATFSDVKKLYANYQSYFGEMIFFYNDPNLNSLSVTSSTFAAVKMSSQYDSILVIMLILGIVVMLVTLFNYYNILSYNSKTRIKYYGIMRAMGTKKAEYSRLRITEMALTLCISLIVASIISLCICTGLIATANNPTVNSMLYQINLSLAYFPVAIAVTFGIYAIIGVFILFMTRIKQRKTSIVHALRSNRH